MIVRPSQRVMLAWVFAAACANSPTIVTAPPQRASFNANGEGSQASDAAHRDLALLRDTLLAADRAWAALGDQTNLVEALAAPMAPDGIFLAPVPSTGFLRGPDQVRDALNANPANKTAKWHSSVIRAECARLGMATP